MSRREQVSPLRQLGRLAVPVLLVLLALHDLRVEVQLLVDHVTVTALLNAIAAHPLAVAVLVFSPELFRRYR